MWDLLELVLQVLAELPDSGTFWRFSLCVLLFYIVPFLIGAAFPREVGQKGLALSGLAGAGLGVFWECKARNR
jgi:hypothetical protein